MYILPSIPPSGFGFLELELDHVSSPQAKTKSETGDRTKYFIMFPPTQIRNSSKTAYAKLAAVAMMIWWDWENNGRMPTKANQPTHTIMDFKFKYFLLIQLWPSSFIRKSALYIYNIIFNFNSDYIFAFGFAWILKCKTKTISHFYTVELPQYLKKK